MSETSTSMPAAGFRQINTKVRRMGDFGDYFFDGSWKASSFANPPDYLNAKNETPWTQTLNFKPVCGLEGPPSLWHVKQVQETPMVKQEKIFKDGLSKRGNNLPGYTGYIPGLKAETVYGSLRPAVNDYCESIRQYETKDLSVKALTYPADPIGKRSLSTILATSDMKYTQSYGTPDTILTDEHGRKYVAKDHRIPEPREKDFVNTKNVPGNSNSKSDGGCGILGWTGFRPQMSRTVEKEPRYVVREGMDSHPGYTGYRPGKFVG